jgi:phosphoglycerol transferase MdoB-like AlkP superfamily enzyme
VIGEGFMDTAFLIVSIILIIGAELLYWKQSSRNTMITKGQKALAVFQIVLSGRFFALCLSDVLDIKANFSAVRIFLNIFYALVFLSMAAFALSDLQRKKQKHIQVIVCLCAALIAVQCFVFPYDAQNEFIRILEAVEGIAVFTMLIILATRISDEKYGQRALAVIVVLELAVAVLNTELPTAFITDDIQITDIPMNFLALYMRPVIFASLALIHRIWLDLYKAGSQKE